MPARPATCSVVLADWWRDADAIRQVRSTVFIEEQGIPAWLEWDGQDADCDHMLVVDRAGQALATGRLMPDGRIGRMAVLPTWRGHGIGRCLLEALQQQARLRGLQETYLHAQVAVAGFYRQAGFSECGEAFVEAGIPHIQMRCLLD